MGKSIGHRSWAGARNPLHPIRSTGERVGLLLAALIGLGLVIGVTALIEPVRNTAHTAVPSSGAEHLVTATVISSVRVGGNQAPGATAVQRIETVEWGWEGRSHVERMHTDHPRSSGATMKIRVDDRGELIPDPMMDLDPRTLTVLLMLTLIGIAVRLGAVTWRLLAWWLLQCRLHAWDREWEQVNARARWTV